MLLCAYNQLHVKRIVTVITHSKNEMHHYLLNKKPTRAFVDNNKIFVKFVSKYQYDQTILLRDEGIKHLCACLIVLLAAFMKRCLISMLFLSLIFACIIFLFFLQLHL